MNADLLKPFTAEEVEFDLFQMGPHKAPGPDVYDACFYQDHWSIVKEEVCQAVLSFLNSKCSIAEINFTHLVMIPKKPSPRLLNIVQSAFVISFISLFPKFWLIY